MDRTELYLKTAFCCTACDGDIAASELNLIKSLHITNDAHVEEKLDEYLQELKEQGKHFIQQFLEQITSSHLSSEEECTLANIAVQTIEADEAIEYSEIAFFKKIRARLHVADDELASSLQHNAALDEVIGIEDYLQPDIQEGDELPFLDNIEMAVSRHITITTQTENEI